MWHPIVIGNSTSSDNSIDNSNSNDKVRIVFPPLYILQRGVQLEQGVVIWMVLYIILLYNTTPIHCTPLRLHPPLQSIHWELPLWTKTWADETQGPFPASSEIGFLGSVIIGIFRAPLLGAHVESPACQLVSTRRFPSGPCTGPLLTSSPHAYARATWIPFGDHPRELERHTEKISMAPAKRMTRTHREG